MLNLYIMVDPHKPDFVKIGITKNLAQRLKAYRTAAPRASFIANYPIPHKVHESRILDRFRDIFEVDRELVKCPADIAINIVEGYLSDENIL